MWKFASTCFNKHLMIGPIPANILALTLEQSESSNALEDELEECVAIINQNDSFTVVYWYSRGKIDDQSLIGLNLRDDAQFNTG